MLRIPARAADRPHPSFLQKHRAVFFAKNGAYSEQRTDGD
jgi:hypothetical protein